MCWPEWETFTTILLEKKVNDVFTHMWGDIAKLYNERLILMCPSRRYHDKKTNTTYLLLPRGPTGIRARVDHFLTLRLLMRKRRNENDEDANKVPPVPPSHGKCFDVILSISSSQLIMTFASTVIKPFWDPHFKELAEWQHLQSLPKPPTNANLTKKGNPRKNAFCLRCGAQRNGATAVAPIDKHNPKWCKDGVYVKLYSLPFPQPDGLFHEGKFSTANYVRFTTAVFLPNVNQQAPATIAFKAFLLKHGENSLAAPKEEDWPRVRGGL
ncbi:hypothetical protein P7C70_g7394, partial [Phenoliferia sp. Uapishka_3]